jgi:hypothetical protein
MVPATVIYYSDEYEDLVEMPEFAEAARLWALTETEFA